MIQVKEHSNLYRDETSGAVINKDKNGARISREARAKALADKERIQKLEEELTEIKDILKQLLEKQYGN